MSISAKYEINWQKKYGEGAYGATYAAKNKETGEEVAVKKIDMTKMAERAILKEVGLLEQLKHPNIIEIRDHGRGEGSARHDYLIYMECASGGELYEQVIKRGIANTMPELLARGLFTQMLKAVRYCHSYGVAHRDIKPENVLLDKANVIKLIDFGLAHSYPRADDKSIDRSEQLYDVCGSHSYAAPEVLAANKRLGHGYDGFACDAWSLGVTLFCLVAGFLPLERASDRDWRYCKLRDEQATDPSASTTAIVHRWYSRPCAYLSAEMIDLLDKLLLIDPKKRISLDDAVDHPWVRELKLEPPPVSADSSEERKRSAEAALAIDDDDDDDSYERPVYRSVSLHSAQIRAPPSAPCTFRRV